MDDANPEILPPEPTGISPLRPTTWEKLKPKVVEVMIFYSTESAIFALGREGIPFQWNTKVTFQAKGKGDPLGRPHPLKLCRIIVSALWF